MLEVIRANVAYMPEEVVSAIAKFLLDNKSGQIIIGVNQGRIESYELKEHRRVNSKF